MSEWVISALMQNQNNHRFQELLAEAEIERRYRQQTPRRPQLWQRMADRLLAVGKWFKPREAEIVKSACICSETV